MLARTLLKMTEGVPSKENRTCDVINLYNFQLIRIKFVFKTRILCPWCSCDSLFVVVGLRLIRRMSRSASHAGSWYLSDGE